MYYHSALYKIGMKINPQATLAFLVTTATAITATQIPTAAAAFAQSFMSLSLDEPVTPYVLPQIIDFVHR